jgi:hypothetical protein
LVEDCAAKRRPIELRPYERMLLDQRERLLDIA